MKPWWNHCNWLSVLEVCRWNKRELTQGQGALMLLLVFRDHPAKQMDTMGTNLPSSKNNLPQKTYKEETTPFHQVLPKQPFPPGILTHPPRVCFVFFLHPFRKKGSWVFEIAKCHLQKQGRKWMKVKHRWCQLNLYKQPRIRGGSTDPNENRGFRKLVSPPTVVPLRLRPHYRATTTPPRFGSLGF